MSGDSCSRLLLVLIAADYGRVVELCKFMRFLSRRLRVANPNVQPVALSG